MPDLTIRAYDDADEAPVLELLAASLGKTVDDRYRGFFRWKHLENPFGRSFMWVGEVEGRIVGFRSFLRWRFVDPGGEPVEAVRAVDTATHPDAQGMGIFRELTLHGLAEMRPAGIDFVFNTPNDQSRPGYLKMGWEVAGRVPMQVRPRAPGSLWRMARAHTAADQWSVHVDIARSISIDQLSEIARPAPIAGSLVTDRQPDFVSWRYGGFEAVMSRAATAGDGAVLVRFRQRGGALECTVGDVVGPVAAPEAGGAVRGALHGGGADYAIASRATRIAGMFRATRLGPVQTRREVRPGGNRLPLSLSLGDVELF